MSASPSASTIPYTNADLAYVRAGFVPLEELCGRRGHDAARVRDDIAAGRLPRPTYVLPEGEELVPADYFDLAEQAGGPDGVRELFLERYRGAGGRVEDAEEEWNAYLSGEYGVCLHSVTPESIVRKAELMARIEELLAAELPDDGAWQSALREAVDALDALERPFAPHYDRLRFGVPSSRDRLITATRERFPAAFSEPE